MLFGVVRKVSIPVLLLALTGWIIYGVGFGLRNFRYKENSDKAGDDDFFGSLLGNKKNGNTAAAAPDYIFFWIFLCSAPLVFAFGFLYSLWESKIPAFFIYLFLPSFLISAGAVFFLDGAAIYAHYQADRVNIFCFDARAPFSTNIHKELSYIPVEFAGAVTSIVFYWVYLLMLPFFGTKYTLLVTH